MSLWEAMLPDEVLRLPEESARMDALLDDTGVLRPRVSRFLLITFRRRPRRRGRPGFLAGWPVQGMGWENLAAMMTRRSLMVMLS